MLIVVDYGIKINEDDEKEILENMESDSTVMAKEEMDKRICKMKRGKQMKIIYQWNSFKYQGEKALFWVSSICKEAF